MFSGQIHGNTLADHMFIVSASVLWGMNKSVLAASIAFHYAHCVCDSED